MRKYMVTGGQQRKGLWKDTL